VGTREDPIPVGTTVALGDGWQVTVQSVIPDATAIVLKENAFNKQPKEGDQFFLAKVQAKYTGPNSATFGGSYRLRAVGPSSIGYRPSMPMTRLLGLIQKMPIPGPTKASPSVCKASTTSLFKLSIKLLN
jgi:hypothetical protein